MEFRIFNRQSKNLSKICAAALEANLFDCESEEIRPFLEDGVTGNLKQFIAVFCFDGGVPVGVAKLEYSKKSSSANYIHVYIAPSFRGQGAGKECVSILKSSANKLQVQAWGHTFGGQTEFFKKQNLLHPAR